MTVRRRDKKQAALERILQQLLDVGNYPAAIISDGDGLTLASAGGGERADRMAAIAGLLSRSAARACQQLDLAHTDELSVRGGDRSCLVCRFFDAGQPLNLTLIVPPDQAYRRTTNHAIRRIQDVWVS